MSELSDVAAVLAGKPAEKAPEPAEERTEPAASQEQEAVPPEAPAEAESAEPEQQETAEAPEWKPEYYDLEIPGLDMTAGEFKDRAKQLKQADEILADAERHKQESESETLRARQTVEALIAEAGIQPTQEQLQATQQRIQEYNQHQHAEAVSNIPDYEPGLEADQAFAQAEGLLSAAEFQAATDWRYRRFVRNFRLLSERVQAAVAGEIKPKRQHKPKPSQKTSASDVDRAVSDYKAGKVSQQSAVAAILAGGTK